MKSPCNLLKLSSSKSFRTSYAFLSLRHFPTNNVQPIHMAYTAFEAINQQNKQNETPILILHGLLGSKANWNSMGRQMALNTFRKVITLDLRNHGDSPHTKEFSYDHIVADIKEVISELNCNEVTLIGHSLGGRASMAFALKYPDLVHDLVIVDISPVRIGVGTRDLPHLLKAMLSVTLPASTTTLVNARIEADRKLQSSIQDKNIRSFLLMNLAFDDNHKKFYWKANIEALLQSLNSLMEFPFDKGVFNKRTLFIAGKLSDFMSKQDEPAVRKRFPKAIFEYIEDAGHLIHIQQPQMFLNRVTAFLGEQNVPFKK